MKNATKLPFVKMHGAGNDYIYMQAEENDNTNWPQLAKEISDVHFGIGADGLVLIMPSKVADFKMRIFNADGSEAQMCGNASRCIAKYVYEKGLTNKKIIKLETLAGIRNLKVVVDGGKVKYVTVNMGKPHLLSRDIPVISEDNCDFVETDIKADDKCFRITAIGMGNPHGVVYAEDLSDNLVHHYGPIIEHSDIWPEKANIEFVKIIDRTHLEMRVWERGSGETLACGTGACAAAVASMLHGLCERKVSVSLPGGNLHIVWDEQSGDVFMVGEAEFVAEGIYYHHDD